MRISYSGFPSCRLGFRLLSSFSARSMFQQQCVATAWHAFVGCQVPALRVHLPLSQNFDTYLHASAAHA